MLLERSSYTKTWNRITVDPFVPAYHKATV